MLVYNRARNKIRHFITFCRRKRKFEADFKSDHVGAVDRVTEIDSEAPRRCLHSQRKVQIFIFVSFNLKLKFQVAQFR